MSWTHELCAFCPATKSLSDGLHIHHDPDQVKVVTEEYLEAFVMEELSVAVMGNVIKNKNKWKWQMFHRNEPHPL